MKVVYISGPYSADTRAEILIHIAEAVEMASALRRKGFAVIVPHLESSFSEDALPEGATEPDFWIEHGIALLRKCDAVVEIRYGRWSFGVEKEIAEAKRLGIPVFDRLSDLIDWRDSVDEEEGEG